MSRLNPEAFLVLEASLYLQFLINLLLDRSAHLRRVDSHYSRARSVRRRHPGVSLRIPSAVAAVPVAAAVAAGLGDEARDGYR